MRAYGEAKLRFTVFYESFPQKAIMLVVPSGHGRELDDVLAER